MKLLSFNWLAPRVDRLINLLPVLVAGIFFALMVPATLIAGSPFIAVGVAFVVSALLAGGITRKLLNVKRIWETPVYVASRQAYGLATTCLALTTRVKPYAWLDECLITANPYGSDAVTILRFTREEFDGITEAPEEGISVVGELIILGMHATTCAPFEARVAPHEDGVTMVIKAIRWPDAYTRLKDAPPEERTLIRGATEFDSKLPELITQLEEYLRILQERASE